MKPDTKGPTLNGNKNKPNVFLIFLLVILLLGAIGLGLYTVMNQQFSTKSRADEAATDPTAVVEVASPSPDAEVTAAPTEAAAESSTVVEIEGTITPTLPAATDESATESKVVDTTVAPTAEPTAEPTVEPTLEPTVAPIQALTSALSCPANGASCAWDAVNGASSYNVSIVDKTTNDVVTTQTISGTSVSFTPIIEHTYECSVQAVNECGTSSDGKGTNTCGPNVTPTPPSSTPTPGPSATPTPGPSATPTPPGSTVIVQNVTGGAAPTIPSAGSSSTVYFMVVATILVATLFLVF